MSDRVEYAAGEPTELRGWADTKFANVVAAFDAALPGDGRHGAALSVWINGRPAVEVQGGVADHQAPRRWVQDTLTPVHSCTKGVSAVAVALLIERGLLESYEVLLSSIWPEFAAAGKKGVTVGDALAHRAGLSAPRETLTREQLLDGETLAASLARQEPIWKPGTTHQYHALTHGVFAEQIVKRLDGRTLGRLLFEEVARPLSADVWIGLPLSEWGRLAQPGSVAEDGGDPDGLPDESPIPDQARYWLERATNLGGALPLTSFVDTSIYAAEMAGAGGVASASGLARLWSATVVPTNGVRLLSDETLEAMTAPRSVGRPYLGGRPPYQSWGAGVMIPSAWERYLTPSSFGHDGGGGMVAFADPEYRVGFRIRDEQARNLAARPIRRRPARQSADVSAAILHAHPTGSCQSGCGAATAGRWRSGSNQCRWSTPPLSTPAYASSAAVSRFSYQRSVRPPSTGQCMVRPLAAQHTMRLGNSRGRKR
jgi:CubicO group peptidase (beta-lactamase class C family)